MELGVSMKILDSFWFTGEFGVIGVVIIEDDKTGSRKAYIGLGRGSNERNDAMAIAHYGVPFYPHILEAMVKRLDIPQKKVDK